MKIKTQQTKIYKMKQKQCFQRNVQMYIFISKIKSCQINNLTLLLMKLEKKEVNPKTAEEKL